MFDGQLQIGTFVFETDDLPEKAPLGGDQLMAVLQFPGGYREVQTFGTSDRNPSWTGRFNYNAKWKVQQLDAIWRKGQVVPITVGSLTPRYGVIKSFYWDYMNDFQIEYSIEIQLAPEASLLQSGSPGSTTVAAPKSVAQAPQKTHIVKSGETLWNIACKYFNGDGSQYRKIATANNIKNPDVVTVGQKLVIPT